MPTPTPTPYDQLLHDLQAARGDTARLALVTFDFAVRDDPRLQEVAVAAAIPHWFDAEILAALLPERAEQAADLVEQLKALPMVEPFTRGDGSDEEAAPAWNVHEATRLALSDRLLADDLARAQGDIPAALSYWIKANAIAQRLAASDPANAAWQRDLSVSLNKLGDLAVAQGDLDGATRSYSEGKAIRERLAASDPANAAWQRDLFYSCFVIASKVFMPQERWVEALELMEKSVTISERLAATDPTNVTWQNDAQVSRRLVMQLKAKVSEE